MKSPVLKIFTRSAPLIAGPAIAWISVFIGCVVLAQSAVAQEAAVAHGESAAQVYAAEKLMHSGDFSAAVDAYRVLADPSGTSTYNYGIALYRTGQIEQAAEKFRSLRAAPQSSLAGRARFNLGNTYYARALAAIEPSEEAGETDQAGQGTAGQPDLDTAITHLQEAIGQYRSSLRVTPADNDARANIELAQRLIRQLRDQKEQQKEQQQQKNEQEQQNQDGEQQDKQEQSSDSQDSPNESQEESGSPEEKENDSDEPSEQSSDDSQQESKKDQPGSEGDSKPQAGENDGGEDNKGDPETDSNTPPSSNNNGERNEASDTEASDTEARADESTDEDESADSAATPEGELTAENEDSGEKKGDARPREIAPLEPGKLTPEEARKLLQSIRDRDMLRRYQRQMLERSRRVPVDRDW